MEQRFNQPTENSTSSLGGPPPTLPVWESERGEARHILMRARDVIDPAWAPILDRVALRQEPRLLPYAVNLVLQLSREAPRAAGAVESMLVAHTEGRSSDVTPRLVAAWHEARGSAGFGGANFNTDRVDAKGDFILRGRRCFEGRSEFDTDLADLWERCGRAHPRVHGEDLALSILTRGARDWPRSLIPRFIGERLEHLFEAAAQPGALELLTIFFMSSGIAERCAVHIDQDVNRALGIMRLIGGRTETLIRDLRDAASHLTDALGAAEFVTRGGLEGIYAALKQGEGIAETSAAIRTVTEIVRRIGPVGLGWSIPLVAVCFHPHVHQDGIRGFEHRLRGGWIRGAADCSCEIREIGARALVELLSRVEGEHAERTALLCRTVEWPHPIRLSWGARGSLGAAALRTAERLLPGDLVVQRSLALRDLDLHHGFGALAVEAAKSPGVPTSLFHRFVQDSAVGEFVNLAPHDAVPEWALIIETLAPERLFVVHDPDHERFAAYEQAWPEYRRALRTFHQARFVISRRFVATCGDRSTGNASVWVNSHYANARGTVALSVPGEALLAAVRTPHHDSPLERLRRQGVVSNEARVLELPRYGHRLAEGEQELHHGWFDLLRLGFALWKRGFTAERSEDHSAPKSDDQPGWGHNHPPTRRAGDAATGSEAEHESYPGRERMLREAWRWHAQHGMGIVDKHRFPLMVIADPRVWSTAPRHDFVLDTLDMTVRSSGEVLRLPGRHPREREESTHRWHRDVMPLLLDRPDEPREPRFILRPGGNV